MNLFKLVPNKLRGKMLTQIVRAYQPPGKGRGRGNGPLSGMMSDYVVPSVQARWLDENGVEHDERIEGMLATCLQHEMDHLEGILFIDHLSKLKRDMVLKKLEKARRLRKAA